MGSVSTIPIVLIYSFTYLFYLLGLSFLAGLSVFAVALLVNFGLGMAIQVIDTKLMKRKDERMNHTTEALNNIKTLKFYCWTDAFEREIGKRREAELKTIKVQMFWIVLIITSINYFPNLLSTVVFSTFLGTGHTTTLANAFSILVFFGLIKEPLIELPWALSSFI